MASNKKNTQSYQSGTDYEQTAYETKIDRNNTRPTYRYVEGKLHAPIVGLAVPRVAPNPKAIMKPGEKRYYLTQDGYFTEVTGPIDYRQPSVIYEPQEAPVYREGYQEPGTDVYIWSDGTSQIVRRQTPVQPTKPSIPIVAIPDIGIPSNPNDNTSTPGSHFPVPITGTPQLPIDQQPIQLPDDYVRPEDEWEEGSENVNGGVRKFWKNKRTGKIVRVRPYKLGGGLNKWHKGGLLMRKGGRIVEVPFN